MTAPTNAPVVSSIPYFGPAYLLGQSNDEYQPLKVSSWNVIIPNPLIGNEAKAGFAAFTVDGVNVTCGTAGALLPNLVGIFQNQYYQEGDVGSLTYNATFGNNFQAPILAQGAIYAFNSTAINVATALTAGATTALQVVLATTNATLFPVGSFFQGTAPGAVTAQLDVSLHIRPRLTPSGGLPGSAAGNPPSNLGVIPAGAGFLADVLILS